MKQCRIVPWDVSDPHILVEALAVLRRGALLALPTDTVYGIAADPRVPDAEERLCRAKGRPEDKPIPLLAADWAQIEQWHPRVGPVERELARRFWPGALTLVLAIGDHPPSPEGSMANGLFRQRSLGVGNDDRKNRLRRVSPLSNEEVWSRERGTAQRLHWEGFRIPNHPVALAVLRAAGSALRVTSANRSGAPPAVTAPLAVEALGDSVELVLDAGAVPGGLPSTVVRIGTRTMDILREGAIPERELFEAYRALTRACPSSARDRAD